MYLIILAVQHNYFIYTFIEVFVGASEQVFNPDMPAKKTSNLFFTGPQRPFS